MGTFAPSSGPSFPCLPPPSGAHISLGCVSFAGGGIVREEGPSRTFSFFFPGARAAGPPPYPLLARATYAGFFRSGADLFGLPGGRSRIGALIGHHRSSSVSRCSLFTCQRQDPSANPKGFPFSPCRDFGGLQEASGMLSEASGSLPDVQRGGKWRSQRSNISYFKQYFMKLPVLGV